VSQTEIKPQLEDLPPAIAEEAAPEALSVFDIRARAVGHLRLIWGKRQFIAKAFLAGLAIGCVVALLIPAQYESSVYLMPPDNQSTSGLAMLAALSAKSGTMSSAAGDLLGVKSSGALFVRILASRTIEDRLIERFQLKKVYSIKLDEGARRKLAESSGFSEDRKSGIISISVTDRDPIRAAAIAQAYVEELNQLVAKLSTSAAHRERVFLEERLGAVKQDLDNASEKFSQFASKNSAIDIKEQGRAMVDAASKLQGELIAAEAQLKGLEEIYTHNNVRVLGLKARVSELQRQLEKLSGNGMTEAGAIGKPPYSGYPSIRELPILGVTYSDLYRRTRIEEAVYETLTQQYELAKVQEAKETPSVKVLDAPLVPERKSFPPRTLIALLGAFLGLGAATMVVFVRSRWDEVDSNDPGKAFAQEVFQSAKAYLPWASKNGSHPHSTVDQVSEPLAPQEDEASGRLRSKQL
jgi:uncharacterized protein involved in exopolysaccharide biosynthesis